MITLSKTSCFTHLSMQEIKHTKVEMTNKAQNICREHPVATEDNRNRDPGPAPTLIRIPHLYEARDISKAKTISLS
uniref:Uncharacterized protein n=1 Tax=Rhizophora mucronata TaxID=61149 RepID=A0A2P2NHR9_RHIMU